MTADAKNSIPKNKRPLPKKTVAKNRSSSCTQTVAQHADEPEECNSRKRNQIYRQRNCICIGSQP